MATYAFVGIGALGGYYASLLHKSGKEVHFLMRSDVEHVRHNGFRVDSIFGDFVVHPEYVYDNPAEMQPADFVCVSLKATQNHELFPLLEQISKPGGTIVILQNGYGLEQQIAQTLPDRVIVGGLCFICAQKIGPGHIKHMDYGAVRFGVLPRADRAESGVLAELAADFAGAGVETHILHDLVLARWQKLMWNIPFNGLCTLLRENTHSLMEHPASMALVVDLMKEIQAGAKLCGAEITDAFLEKMIADTKKMTPYKPSMQIDFEHGRPLEWEAIYQKPIEAVREMGGSMPKVEAIMYQLAFLSRQPVDSLL